jgi:hypothetical protein
VQRDPNPRRTHQAETFSPLLRHHNPLPATNEIGVEEASARNEAWMLNRRSTYALQRTGKCWGEARCLRVRPATRPLGRNMEWDGVRWDRTAIHPPRSFVEICSKEFPNNGA